MAELQGGLSAYSGGAPNLLGAIQTGAGIARGRQQGELALGRYNRETEQIALENQRIQTRDAEKLEDREIDTIEKNLSMALKYKNYDQADVHIKEYNAKTGVNLRGDFAAMGKHMEAIDKAQAAGKAEEVEYLENDFLTKFHVPVGQGAEVLGRPDVAGRYAAEEKLQTTVAGEERKLKGQKALETFKTDEEIRQEKARVKTVGTKTRKPDNQRFVDAEGNVSFVNINDPVASAVAKAQGLSPETKSTAGKVVDKEQRGLKLLKAVSNQAVKEADIKFGKPPAKQKFDSFSGQWVENTEYPFDEYTVFVTEKMDELKKKAGISEEQVPPEAPAQRLQAGVPSHRQGAETIDSKTLNTFQSDPNFKPGYTLSSEKDEKGRWTVYDEAGTPISYWSDK